MEHCPWKVILRKTDSGERNPNTAISLFADRTPRNKSYSADNFISCRRRERLISWQINKNSIYSKINCCRQLCYFSTDVNCFDMLSVGVSNSTGNETIQISAGRKKSYGIKGIYRYLFWYKYIVNRIFYGNCVNWYNGNKTGKRGEKSVEDFGSISIGSYRSAFGFIY